MTPVQIAKHLASLADELSNRGDAYAAEALEEVLEDYCLDKNIDPAILEDLAGPVSH